MAENLYTPFCIRTMTGQYVDVTVLGPEQILIDDIAIALARECRFGGFTKRDYSVAEHSVWCMKEAERLYPGQKSLHLAVLLHDGHEAYVGDWPSPMVAAIDKRHPGFAEVIASVKRHIQLNIHIRFGIQDIDPSDERIKKIDRMALEYEWENKMLKWNGFPPMGSAAIADYFITCFHALVKTPYHKQK